MDEIADAVGLVVALARVPRAVTICIGRTGSLHGLEVLRAHRLGKVAAKLGGAAGFGFVSYGEIGIPRVGRFPTGYKSGALEWDGVPLLLVGP